MSVQDRQERFGFTAQAFGEEGSFEAQAGSVSGAGGAGDIGVNLLLSHPYGSAALAMSPEEAEQAAEYLRRAARAAFGLRKREQALEAFEAARVDFRRATAALDSAWERVDGETAGAEEGYPACLPSFDEFAAQVAVWGERS